MTSTLSVTELSSAEILTQITGQQIQSHHLTPRVMFLSSLSTVLVGVTYADEKVADEEKLYIQKILSQFAVPESINSNLVKVMIQGIRKHRTYLHSGALKRLAQTLSPSEKLLVVGLGCKLATADGSVGESEKQYLCKITQAISVPNEHLNVLLSCLANDGVNSHWDSIEELRYLLDPQRFQNIDLGLVKVASYICSKLPKQVKPGLGQVRNKPSYEKLEVFQGFRGRLSSLCDELTAVVIAGQEQGIFPAASGKEVAQLSERIQSQRFRLAIVGEFSQGKSTLLNALLGEEIQPVRAIPCSGTLTTLKYGAEKRVTCHYKNGRQEDIPVEQYQQKASIPEEIALGDELAQGLAASTITEIVLEHPGLELCRHHVEIVDSPGLNEHPDRTAVTERLLQDADAAIFLANASRPLTQGERELLTSLKRQLQKDNPDEPAGNLFVLVNFMDMLRTQQDKEQVQQLVGNFLQGTNSLLSGDSRVHFISAQAALDSQLEQTENEYSATFSDFVSALEKFLAEERGEIVLRKGIADVQNSITGLQNSLSQTLNLLEGKLSLSEAEQSKLLDQIGSIGGFDVKIQSLRDELLNDTYEKICESWNQWVEGLEDRLIEKTNNWTSHHENKRSILKDYAEQSAKDISEEFENWFEKIVVKTILQPNLKKLEVAILQTLVVIKRDLQAIDCAAGTSLDKQFELSMSNLGIDMEFSSNLDPNAVEDSAGFFDRLATGGGFGGAVVAAMGFTPFGLLSIFLVGGAVGIVSSFLFRDKDLDTIKQELKQHVFDGCVEKFVQSNDVMFEKVIESIVGTVDERVSYFSQCRSRLYCPAMQLTERRRKNVGRDNSSKGRKIRVDS